MKAKAKSIASARRYRAIADIHKRGQNSGMSTPGKYAGMTVNERLFEARLIDEFDAASRASDRTELIRILTEVEVEDAAWCADTRLQNPERYAH